MHENPRVNKSRLADRRSIGESVQPTKISPTFMQSSTARLSIPRIEIHDSPMIRLSIVTSRANPPKFPHCPPAEKNYERARARYHRLPSAPPKSRPRSNTWIHNPPSQQPQNLTTQLKHLLETTSIPAHSASDIAIADQAPKAKIPVNSILERPPTTSELLRNTHHASIRHPRSSRIKSHQQKTPVESCTAPHPAVSQRLCARHRALPMLLHAPMQPYLRGI